jgi:hypothetical protein
MFDAIAGLYGAKIRLRTSPIVHQAAIKKSIKTKTFWKLPRAVAGKSPSPQVETAAVILLSVAP